MLFKTHNILYPAAFQAIIPIDKMLASFGMFTLRMFRELYGNLRPFLCRDRATGETEMTTSTAERWNDRIAAKHELDPWLAGGLRLEKAGASAAHRLWGAAKDGRALWLLALPGTDSTINPPRVQSFIVQHDWASAFQGATDFEEGDYRLPYDSCCFELKLSGKRVCAFVREEGDQKNGWGGEGMAKWIITWDTGFGASSEVVEAADEDQATKMAYEAWRQQAEDNADYKAEPYSKEMAEELEIE